MEGGRCSITTRGLKLFRSEGSGVGRSLRLRYRKFPYEAARINHKIPRRRISLPCPPPRGIREVWWVWGFERDFSDSPTHPSSLPALSHKRGREVHMGDFACVTLWTRARAPLLQFFVAVPFSNAPWSPTRQRPGKAPLRAVDVSSRASGRAGIKARHTKPQYRLPSY